ncbi:FAD/NAD(P)-binding domain-containing protein, partial [Melanomma pulvis-pyrius CBS 109.77]
MRFEYDIVVIGSGYGGGIAASRTARAGKSVCILERGREKWPGEYPSALKDAAREFHVSGYVPTKGSGNGNNGTWNSTGGKPTGMYHLTKGEGQDVFVANGLGGTSLINANVFLRADHRALELSEWPAEIRENPAELDKYYARAEHMFQPTPYPTTSPCPQKLSVFEKQAKTLKQERNFYRAPQTTFFHDGINNAGVEMKASTGSGNDTTGINDGSKNSVLMNYLPDAWNWGAEIFCECEVRYIQKDKKGKGYLVFYAWHGDGREGFGDEFNEQLMWVRARELCFLGAGALGTTEILLRSRTHGLPTSPLLGQKISGNGDILSFAYNTDEIVNGVGSNTPSAFHPCGPTITGMIDNRGSEAAPNVRDGHVIQEGAIPETLAPIIQSMLDVQPGKIYPTKFDRLRHLWSRMKTMMFGAYAKGSSVNRTQAYLIMSHDSNEGILQLRDDKPDLQFIGVGRAEHAAELRSILAKATDSVGGVFINSPSMTVHPLGGARMSSDGTGLQGAVNHVGQLFVGNGEEVHEGIVCVDGSTIPTALGVNPCATIAALAERTCALLIKAHSWTVDDTPNGTLDLFGKPVRSTINGTTLEPLENDTETTDRIHFCEILTGHIHIGSSITSFPTAESAAKGASSSARLSLTVDVSNVSDLFSDSTPSKASIATGTFACGALSQDPLLVLRGEVRFFTVNDEVSDGTNLDYKLTLLSTKGETYFLHGFKNIDSDMAFSGVKTWKATTTLFTTLTREDGSAVGRGILNISWRNFVNEMRSFRSSDESSLAGRLLAPTLFLAFFVQKTMAYFLSPFRPLETPDYSKSGYFSKPAPKIVPLVADDGVKTVIKVWEPKEGVRKREMPIVMIPGASVDDRIFSLPTIPTNTVDYFTGLGYRCYIPVLRFGIGPAAEEGWTAYDARLDVKVALEYVRAQESNHKVYVLCHCLGSIATAIALLTGTIDASWIQGMTCSQVFTNLIFSPDNALKASSPVLLNLYRTLLGPWFPCSPPLFPPAPTPATPSTYLQPLLDQVLRFYPLGPRRNSELCNSPVCHRCTLVFGRCFTHANLNHATHAHMGKWFSGIHMDFLRHLMRMGAVPPHHVRSNEKPATKRAIESGDDGSVGGFADLVLQAGNMQRLQHLRIQFLSGGANAVFDPASTAESYEMFRETFPGRRFERVVVEGYGHLDTWMGVGSALDVYPRVGAHVEFCE